MPDMTFKKFIKDLFLQLGILLTGCILFYIMKTYPHEFPFAVMIELIETIPFMLFFLTYCILFYHLFFKKLLLKDKKGNLPAILGSLIGGFAVSDVLIMNLILLFRSSFDHFYFPGIQTLFRFLIFTGYAIVYSLIKGLFWLRIQKTTIEKDTAVASLQNLRSCIEPQFIINSLANVHALSVEEKATKTSGSIEELSTLFRYSFKDSWVKKISIEEELNFIEKYIHLHKIRIDENAKIRITESVLWDQKPAQIAPLLLITFIENAFKYGMSFKKNSFIEIHLSVKDCKLTLSVNNSIPGELINVTNGLGLKNARKRLELLYKGKYILKETHNEATHEITLNINLTP